MIRTRVGTRSFNWGRDSEAPLELVVLAAGDSVALTVSLILNPLQMSRSTLGREQARIRPSHIPDQFKLNEDAGSRNPYNLEAPATTIRFSVNVALQLADH